MKIIGKCVVITLNLLLICSCRRGNSIPERPDNVPNDAIYSGNLQSGHWVHCSKVNNLYNCRIYEASGPILIESQFRPEGNVSSTDSRITKMFFNLTYIETNIGNLIPVGPYKIYEPETGLVGQERFYAQEKCQKNVAQVTEADARSILSNFISNYRRNLNGVDVKLTRSQRYVSRDRGRGFSCSGVDLKNFIFKSLRNNEPKITVFVTICANCDHEVSITVGK